MHAAYLIWRIVCCHIIYTEARIFKCDSHISNLESIWEMFKKKVTKRIRNMLHFETKGYAFHISSGIF